MLYSAGEMTVGTVFMVIWYTEILFRPLEQLTRQMEDFQRAGASIGRIDELRQTQSSIEVRAPDAAQTSRGAGIASSGPLRVTFDGVHFGYDPEDLVLRDINLDIAPGRVVGLLGRTGSGKTTISRLLFRLYDVQQGAICVDGTDVRNLEPAALRHRVGIVTQSVQLFRGTVRDNLTFFDKSIPDDHIQNVVARMGLGDWFAALPEGLDTALQSGDGGLSAGEAQLLVFTRVFLKDPGLVILDEASSRLDPATEARIEQAVDHLLAQRTGIIIAHRLSTVSRADEIVILDDGRIAEHGDREALAADPASHFYGLLQTGSSELLA
jgi:ATP-binding cassette, subfamily B, bacterial